MPVPAPLRAPLAPLLRARELDDPPVASSFTHRVARASILKTQRCAEKFKPNNSHTIQNVSGRLFLPLTKRQIVYNIYRVLKNPQSHNCLRYFFELRGGGSSAQVHTYDRVRPRVKHASLISCHLVRAVYILSTCVLAPQPA